MRHILLLACAALLLSPGVGLAQVLDYAQQTPYPVFGGPARPLLALDGDENVYVAGRLIGTTDFDMSDGVAEIEYDPTAEPYPFSGRAAFVAKYAPDGTYQWAFGLSLDGIARQLDITGIAADADGNVTIVGDFEVRIEEEGDGTAYRPVDFDPGPGVTDLGAFANEDPPIGEEPSNFVASYDTDGNLRWAFELISEVNVLDLFTIFERGARFYDVTTDADGNLYVAGNVTGLNALNGDPRPVDIDPLGGATPIAETGAFLAKYASDGTLVWATATQPGPGDTSTRTDARFERVAVDAAGQAFVAGDFGFGPINVGGVVFGSDEDNIFFTSAFLAQYNAEGTAARWAFPLEDATDVSANFIHSTLRSAPEGGVFWTGYLREAADFDPSPDETIVTAIAYPNGTSFDDAFAAHYTSDGALGWVRQISGIYNREVLDYHADATDDGRTFVIGNATGLERLEPPDGPELGDAVEIVLIEYNLADGARQNLYVEEAAPPTNEDYTQVDVWGMELAPSGRMYLLGNIGAGNGSIPFDFDFGEAETTLPFVEGSNAMFLARYDATMRPVSTETDAAPSSFALAPPYPNPATGPVTLALTLDSAQPVRLDVFDVLGRRVRTLHDGLLPATTHRFTLDGASLPSGTYVVRALTPRGATSMPLVVLAGSR